MFVLTYLQEFPPRFILTNIAESDHHEVVIGESVLRVKDFPPGHGRGAAAEGWHPVVGLVPAREHRQLERHLLGVRRRLGTQPFKPKKIWLSSGSTCWGQDTVGGASFHTAFSGGGFQLFSTCASNSSFFRPAATSFGMLVASRLKFW